MRPCLGCGSVGASSWCNECKPPPRPQHHQLGTTERGYDTAWRKLSERARRMQPWCLDCGATENLTTDHSAEAWARKHDGLTIRLCDVDVLCSDCNTARGSSRPGTTRGDDLPRNASRPRRLGIEALTHGEGV